MYYLLIMVGKRKYLFTVREQGGGSSLRFKKENFLCFSPKQKNPRYWGK
jgi:hypothetical protein